MKTKREIVLGFFRLRLSQKIDIITSLGYFKDYHQSRGTDLERFKAFLHQAHEDDGETFYVALAHQIEDAEIENLPIADKCGPRVSPEPYDVEAVLLKIAGGHQGGHSESGRAIADILDIPFPVTMPNLTIAAKRMGHDPDELWPWLTRMNVQVTTMLAQQRRDIIEEEPSIDDIANEYLEQNDG
jgi:hypothetical protein